MTALACGYTPGLPGPPRIVAGGEPEAAALGDFDGDGKRDVAIANLATSTVTVGMNAGGGVFERFAEYPVGPYPIALVVADMNADGHPDIVALDSNDAGWEEGPVGHGWITVLRNRGDGTFAPKTSYAVGTSPSSLVVIDANGDGAPDIAVSNRHESTVSVLMNDGEGKLSTKRDVAAGPTPATLATADFDGDGRADLVVTTPGTDTLGVFRGRGDGSFDARATYAAGPGPVGVVASDLDGDGNVDLAVANSGSDTVAVLLNTGGTFAAPKLRSAGGHPQWIAIADFDGDGRSDVVTTSPGGHGGHVAKVMRNLGGGKLAAAVDATVGVYPGVSAVGDVDGDGRPDLVVPSGHDGAVSVLLNRAGALTSRVDVPVGDDPTAIATGDFDGNGTLDFVATNAGTKTASVVLRQANGTFTRKDYAAGRSPFSVAVGDLDGDGRKDFVAANWDSDTIINGKNVISVFMNEGSGTFASKVEVEVGRFPTAVALGDLDGDGDLDIVVANGNPYVLSSTISVLTNDGHGAFPSRLDYVVGAGPSAAAITDLDGDGHPDIVVADEGNEDVSVFTNAGDGTFLPRLTYATGTSPTSLAVGDVNGDGKFDLAVGSFNGQSVSVLLNLGGGTFAAKVDYPVGNTPWSVAIADLDGDGANDLAVTSNVTNSVAVLYNRGQGAFIRVDYPTGWDPRGVAAGDIDGDGTTDLLIANQADYSVSILRNTGTLCRGLDKPTAPNLPPTQIAPVGDDEPSASARGTPATTESTPQETSGGCSAAGQTLGDGAALGAVTLLLFLLRRKPASASRTSLVSPTGDG